MSHLHILLEGWDAKRNQITDLTLNAEDADHKVIASQQLSPKVTQASMDLPPGQYSINVQFVAAPHRYATNLGTTQVPATSAVRLDLDSATPAAALPPQA